MSSVLRFLSYVCCAIRVVFVFLVSCFLVVVVVCVRMYYLGPPRRVCGISAVISSFLWLRAESESISSLPCLTKASLTENGWGFDQACYHTMRKQLPPADLKDVKWTTSTGQEKEMTCTALSCAFCTSCTLFVLSLWDLFQ